MNYSYLVVMLREQTPVLHLTGELGGSVELDLERYVDIGEGDWTGFYDWLRSPTGAILGVRYWPFEGTAFLCQALAGLPYVVVDQERRGLEVYFSSDRDFDPQNSGDQEFGDNRVFQSEPGEYALSFATRAIEETELSALRVRVDDD